MHPGDIPANTKRLWEDYYSPDEDLVLTEHVCLVLACCRSVCQKRDVCDILPVAAVGKREHLPDREHHRSIPFVKVEAFFANSTWVHLMHLSTLKKINKSQVLTQSSNHHTRKVMVCTPHAKGWAIPPHLALQDAHAGTELSAD